MSDRKKDQEWVERRRRKYRDSISGEYVSREYAEANPDTTQGESDWRVAALEKRVADLELLLSVIEERSRK